MNFATWQRPVHIRYADRAGSTREAVVTGTGFDAVTGMLRGSVEDRSSGGVAVTLDTAQLHSIDMFTGTVEAAQVLNAAVLRAGSNALPPEPAGAGQPAAAPAPAAPAPAPAPAGEEFSPGRTAWVTTPAQRLHVRVLRAAGALVHVDVLDGPRPSQMALSRTLPWDWE